MESKDTTNINLLYLGEAYVTTVLSDQLTDDAEPKVQAKINCRGGSLHIHVDGYGDSCSLDGDGYPIAIEIADGELRVVVWSDINQEEHTHLIPLTKAKEYARIEE